MAARRVVTYGNWAKPITVGLGKWSGASTAVFFIGALVIVVSEALLGLLWALGAFILTLVAWVLVAKENRDGVTLIQRLGEKIMFSRLRHSGAHLYRGGTAGKNPSGTAQLPGILARSSVKEFTDSLGRPFVVVNHGGGTFAIVLAAQPDGQALVDQSTIDAWVEAYGGWLADLGSHQGLIGAQTIVETTPDSGYRLSQEIHSRLDPRAPTLAREMIEETIISYPSGSARIRVYVTLTFTDEVFSGIKKRDIDEFGREMSRQLPSVTGTLANTGAGVVTPLSQDALCQVVRCAYDPVSQALFDQAEMTGQNVDLSWDDSGPIGAEPQWDYFVHDSGISQTWTMVDAPRGFVQSSVLTNLLAPHPDIWVKRVALMYRPVPVDKSAIVAEADANTAKTRAESARGYSARLASAHARAQKTASDEASGAGIENFGIIVTATTTSVEQLPYVRAVVNSLAGTARIRIRPAYGGQDSAFASALPLGLVPIRHSMVGEKFRNAL